MDELVGDPNDPLQDSLELVERIVQLFEDAVDYDSSLASLAHLLLPRFADWFIIHLFDGEGGLVPVQVGHSEIELIGTVRSAALDWPKSLESMTVESTTTGRSRVVDALEIGCRGIESQRGPHGVLVGGLALHRALIAPLKARGVVLGALTLVCSSRRSRACAQAQQDAEVVAHGIALAIDSARLHNRERVIAGRAREVDAKLEVARSIATSIAADSSPSRVLEALPRCFVPAMADYCVVYGVNAEQQIRRVATACAEPSESALLEGLYEDDEPDFADAEGVGFVARSGEPILTADIGADLLERVARSPDSFERLCAVSPRARIIVPLGDECRRLGVLLLLSTSRSERRYSAADVAFVTDMLQRVSFASSRAVAASQLKTLSRAVESHCDRLAQITHQLRGTSGGIATATGLIERALVKDNAASCSTVLRRSLTRLNGQIGELAAAHTVLSSARPASQSVRTTGLTGPPAHVTESKRHCFDGHAHSHVRTTPRTPLHMDVGSWASSTRSAPTLGELSPPPGPSGRLVDESPWILVVDDDPVYLTEVIHYLHVHEILAVGAVDGEQALNLARASTRPHMILLDMMMPVMDGWRFRSIAASDEELRSVPIVVMTSRSTRAMRSQFNDAAGVLTKPFTGEELLRQVAVLRN